MKSKLAILGLAAVCLWGPKAKADTITTGNLSFTCLSPCSAPTPITPSTFAGTAPTAGSFTYDNTTNQFLDFTLTWDGIIWGFAGLTEANYLALIGSGGRPQGWSGECIGGGALFPWPQFSCDLGGPYFNLFFINSDNTFSDVLDLPVISYNYPTTYPADEEAGTVTATNLVTTTTPEPPVLLLLGIGLVLALIRRIA